MLRSVSTSCVFGGCAEGECEDGDEEIMAWIVAKI